MDKKEIIDEIDRLNKSLSKEIGGEKYISILNRIKTLQSELEDSEGKV